MRRYNTARPYILGILGSVLFAMWATGIVKSTPLTMFVGPAFILTAIVIFVVREVMTHKQIA